MSLLSHINSRSPPSAEIDEMDWSGEAAQEAQTESLFAQQLIELGEIKDKKKGLKKWREIKNTENIEKLIHSPGVMRFLYRCIKGLSFFYCYENFFP